MQRLDKDKDKDTGSVPSTNSPLTSHVKWLDSFLGIYNEVPNKYLIKVIATYAKGVHKL
jgi:hypothetical protein